MLVQSWFLNERLLTKTNCRRVLRGHFLKYWSYEWVEEKIHRTKYVELSGCSIGITILLVSSVKMERKMVKCLEGTL